MSSRLSGRMGRREFVGRAAKVAAALALSDILLPRERTLAAAISLDGFPRPKDDNGLGIHLFPHPYVLGEDLDPWIERMVSMRMKWTTMLNDDRDSIFRLAKAGIQPVVRPFLRCTDEWGDRGLVARWMNEAGLGAYVQAYNE